MYRIDVYHERWECGDGCCSDDWFVVELYKHVEGEQYPWKPIWSCDHVRDWYCWEQPEDDVIRKYVSEYAGIELTEENCVVV